MAYILDYSEEDKEKYRRELKILTIIFLNEN